MDLEALLNARSDAAPSGENLEYDEAFLNMELAATPAADPNADEPDAHTEPNFAELAQAAEAVLERSHDIRAACYLTLAQAKVSGLEGAVEPVAYIRGVLERYWDTCYPEVEDGDAVMRANAVAALAANDGVLQAIRRAPLASSPSLGNVSFRDIAIAEGQIPAPEDTDNLPTPDTISAALADTPEDICAMRIEAVKALRDHFSAIETIFDERAPGVAPDLQPARDILSRILRALPGANSDGDASVDASTDAPDPSKAQADGPVQSGGGAVRSPADVKDALDRIIGYYQRYEPSSPVPILLQRAKRLVSADFLTIVKDIAPEGMENVTRVGGLEEDDD